MSRTLRDHGIIACLSLALAWRAWTAGPPEDGDGGGPQVMFLDPDSVTRVAWAEGEARLTLAREGGPGRAIELAIAPGSQPGTPDRWPASAAAGELFAALPQLRALRRLPAPDAGQRRAWQLDANAATLTVGGSAAGRAAQAVLRVGAGTYGEHDYVVEGEPGEIFLVARHVLSPLAQASTRLQAREALAGTAGEVEAISLRLGDVRRELRLQRPTDGAPAAAWWADADGGAHRLEQVEPWLSRCMQLRVVRLLAAVPEGAPALQVELARTSGPPARLQIWPLGEDGAPARASRFATPVLLHPGAAEAVLRDAQAVAWEGRLSGGEGAAGAPSPAR